MDEKEVKKEFLKFAENLFKKAGALSVEEMKKNEEGKVLKKKKKHNLTESEKY